jgi:hypothetical protein
LPPQWRHRDHHLGADLYRPINRAFLGSTLW